MGKNKEQAEKERGEWEGGISRKKREKYRWRS